MNKIKLLLSVFLFLFSTLSFADDYENAVKNFEQEHYTEAIDQFDALVQKGDGRAANNLGYMYFEGKGLDKNYNSAKKYFEIAEKWNIINAIYSLGVIYRYGLGDTEPNLQKSASFFIRAVKKGHPYSMTSLGELMLYGQGIKQDENTAVDLISDAILENDFSGSKILSIYFYKSFQNEKNPILQTQYLMKSYGWASVYNKYLSQFNEVDEELNEITEAISSELPPSQLTQSANNIDEFLKNKNK